MAAPHPPTSVRCPGCDAKLRLSASAAASNSIRCPKCDEVIRLSPKAGKKSPRPDGDRDEPRRKKKGKKKAAASKLPLIIGGSVLGVTLVAGAVVAIVLAAGSASGPVAQGPPPNPRGDTIPTPPPGPNPEPGNGGQPLDPLPRDVPPDAVPQIPPLPPPDKRPTLVLDGGGHNGTVRNVVFTPDSRYLVTVSTDKTIRLWNLETGETEGVLHLPVGPGAEGAIYAAAVSKDGKRLAVSGSPFGAGKLGILIHLLSLETGQVEKVLTGHAGEVRSLAFSPDGKLLASSGHDGTARVTDVATGQPRMVLQGHKAKVGQVSWSPDGQFLTTASDDKSVMLWQLGNPRPLKVIPQGQVMPCNSVAWSPDGKMFAAGNGDGFIRFYSADGTLVRTNEQLKTVYLNKESPVQVFSLAWTGDSKEVVYGGVHATGHVGIVSAATGKQRLDFPKHNNVVFQVAVSPDGKYVASTGGNENQTVIWTPADGTVVHTLKGAGKGVWAVGWSADGKALVWGHDNRHGADGLATLERAFRLDELDFAPLPQKVMRRVHGTNEGWSLKRTDEFYEITVVKDGKPVLKYSPPEGGRIFDVTLLPGGKMVIALGDGVETLDLNTRQGRRHVGHTSDVTCITPSPDGQMFATGGSDQTVRVWHPDKTDPVLSLFVANRDWIAWTPEGYYAASPQGEQLMGWQTNNGPDRLATYHPASRFHASLFQPEVIANLLPAGGQLGKAVALANQNRRNNLIQAVNLTQVMPPTVALTAPVSGGRIYPKEPTLEIKATAESVGKHPVKAMKLIVDGRPWQGQAGTRTFGDGKLGSVEAAWTVKLSPGRHVIGVIAESAVSKGMSQPLEVIRHATGDDELPNLHVLAIGISAYPGPLRLQYAASDAELITKSFKDRTAGVYKDVNVKLIQDKDATRKNILEALDWLAERMKPDDVGMFYFAGHGGKDRQGNFYLIPVDVTRDLEKSAVPGKVVSDRLGNMPGKLICMMDACHSGTVAEEFQPGRTDSLVRDLVSEDYGVVTMCSSTGREYSLESPETKAGFFTLSISEALSGKADFNKDRYVYINEVDMYAYLRVRQLSGGEQNPVTGRPPTIRAFALSKVSGP